MAAPAVTARVTPVDAAGPMKDGYRCLIAFAADSDALFWEIAVGGWGLDGGEPIEGGHMHHTTWRIMRARQLKALMPFSGRAAYRAGSYTSILALINVEGAITQHFSSGGSLSFFGFLRVFDGTGEMAEGARPEANFTIQPTNWDPANGVEASPVLTGT